MTSGSRRGCSTGGITLDAYDRIIGLDLSEVAIDGSLHKAPCGGEGTGKNPTDRAKLGWKWSVAADANGIPLGWAIDGANRNDVELLEPTLADVARVGLLGEIETLHLDRARLPQDPGPARRGTRRSQHSATQTARHLGAKTPDAPRAALGRRRHQLVAVELRAVTAKH